MLLGAGDENPAPGLQVAVRFSAVCVFAHSGLEPQKWVVLPACCRMGDRLTSRRSQLQGPESGLEARSGPEVILVGTRSPVTFLSSLNPARNILGLEFHLAFPATSVSLGWWTGVAVLRSERVAALCGEGTRGGARHRGRASGSNLGPLEPGWGQLQTGAWKGLP